MMGVRTSPPLVQRDKLRSSCFFDLEILTPIHIGTKEGRLGPTEFVATGGKVYLIDENRLGRFLVGRNLVDAFVMEVQKGPLQMASFLTKTAQLRIPEDLHLVCSRSIPGGDPSMQEFRPFVRDAAGQVYIPGSSLKGVFRTAILYKILKGNQNLLRVGTSKIERDDRFIIGKSRKFYSRDWLQAQSLQSFTISGATEKSNADILRCLTVRDAYPTGEVKTRVIKINFISRAGDGSLYWSQDKKNPRDLFIWVEALVKGTFRLELSWDEALYSVFREENPGRPLPITGLHDLLDAVREMNRDLISHEKEFFNPKLPPSGKDAYREARALRDWYTIKSQGSENLLRVGFGSGMLSTTVGLALGEALRQKIRDACGSGPRPGDPAPKSRRVWKKTDAEVLPMGWLALKEADLEKKPVAPGFKVLGGQVDGEEPGEKASAAPAYKTDRIDSSARVESRVGPSPVEVWDGAEVRWDRGKNEVTALFQGRKGISRLADLDEATQKFLREQKAGKAFRARVTVEVVGEHYRRIVKVEIET